MKKRQRAENLAAAVVCLLTAAVFYALYAAAPAVPTQTVQLVMRVAVPGAAAVALCIMLTRPELDRKEVLLWLVLALGVLMRVGYMLYTPVTVRGHDLEECALESRGHLSYILHLLQGELPPDNVHQFYHPPLFHLLGAGVISCFRWLSGITAPELLVEAAKTVSCGASVVTLFYARKLCRQLGLGGGGTLLAVSLAAFLPNHYLLAGRANNDALAILFMTAILYYTLRWYEAQEWGPLVKLALCYGLGMMTKISVGVFAPVTGVMMLLVLYRRLREKKGAPVLRQLGVFGLISFPLGLWYPVRNFLIFRQPFTYVLRIGEESDLFCGDQSLWARFGPIGEMSLYNDPFRDCNIWTYLVKGSLFGEFTFDMGQVLPALLLAVNLILILLSLVGMVTVLIRRPTAPWIALGCFWLVLMGSYVSFNLQYPFGCTMDFRYIVPNALIGAVFLAGWWEQLQDRQVLRTAAAGCVAVFSLLSIVLCCFLAW